MLSVFIPLMFSTGIWLYIVRKYDKYEPEPLKNLLKVLLIAGFFSTFCAGIFNSSFQKTFNINLGTVDKNYEVLAIFAFFVGINEEFWKLFFTFKLIKEDENFDEPIDGIIYGMTGALGFAAFENIQYMLRFGNEIILRRSLMAVPLHILCGAIWGLGLTYWKFRKKTVFVVIPFLLASAILHGVYDLVLFWGSYYVLLVYLILPLGVIAFVKNIGRIQEDSQYKDEAKCPKCKTVNRAGSKICVKCGEKLDSGGDFIKTCSKCSTKFSGEEESCPKCHTKV